MKESRSFTAIVCLVIIGATGMLFASCAPRSTHYASSVVQYLYPDKKEYVEPTAVPVLALPLRVGIAFVPEVGDSAAPSAWWRTPSSNSGSSYTAADSLTEKEKMALMKTISAEFKQYPYVKSVEMIPSAYLAAGGSFSNLDQIRTMYGVDVMVLLSYDQVQHTDEGLLSLSYWTLVGAYVIRGEKNDTNTMLDAAVFHVPSRKLLFRAPGLSRVKGAATPVNLNEQLRIDSQKGFHEAAAALVTGLKEQLDQFKEKIKESPTEYKIEHKAGYKGGGSLGVIAFSLITVMGGALLWPGNHRKR